MLKKNIIFYLALCLTSSCTPDPCNCYGGETQTASNDSLLTVLVEEQRRKTDSHFLSEFNEPNLVESTKESYRLAILGTIRRDYNVYRVVKEDPYFRFSVKSIDFVTEGDTSFYKVVEELDYFISNTEWNSIKSAVVSNCFWRISVDPIENYSVADGRSWILEGYDPKIDCNEYHYNVAFRQSPHGFPNEQGFVNIANAFVAIDSTRGRRSNGNMMRSADD